MHCVMLDGRLQREWREELEQITARIECSQWEQAMARKGDRCADDKRKRIEWRVGMGLTGVTYPL